LVVHILFLKEINTFIQQVCIQLIKSESKHYVFTKQFFKNTLETFFPSEILEKKRNSWFPQKKLTSTTIVNRYVSWAPKTQ